MKIPIDQWLAEHRIIEKALRALAGLCDRLERGEQIDPDAFDRIFEFLVTFADHRHHQKEEKCLFPALGAQGVPCDAGLSE
jgi:hemerythrin-like domain-containing protein